MALIVSLTKLEKMLMDWIFQHNWESKMSLMSIIWSCLNSPLLEEPVIISHPVDNIPNFQLPLGKDTLLDTQTHSTRHQVYTSYLVACQGQTVA